MRQLGGFLYVDDYSPPSSTERNTCPSQAVTHLQLRLAVSSLDDHYGLLTSPDAYQPAVLYRTIWWATDFVPFHKSLW